MRLALTSETQTNYNELKGMNIMKKTRLFSVLSALTATAAMLTAGLPASAVSMTDATNGVLTVADEETSPNTLTFTKEIAVFNEDTSVASVYGPTITYEYTIAPYEVTATDTITDANGVTVTAKTGVTDGVTLSDSTAVFASSEVALTDGVGVISDDLVASVDLSKFTSAGVYRYKITEADSETARGNASITRDTDNYSTDRYLDVYIRNTDEGLAVSAYVMFHVGSGESTTIDGTTNATAATNTEKKTDGYDVADNNGSETSSADGTGNMGDKYYTYNYEVEKEITGSLADKSHKFPFVVSTTASSNAGQTFNIITPEGTTTGTIGTNVEVGLADGETLQLIGLPATATVAVTETNDTSDTYKTTIASPTVAEASVASNGTAGFSAQNLTNYAVTLNEEPTKNADITGTKFTNKLDEISPTGVILTAAPYAIMLAVACFLMALYMKNKKKDESESAI